MKFYMVDEGQLSALRRVATRLYSERRMNGDEMRDAAHAITAVVETAEQLEVPEKL